MATEIKWAKKFLKGYAETGKLLPSAKAAGVARQTVYAQKAADPRFAAACDNALKTYRAAIAKNAAKEAEKRKAKGAAKAREWAKNQKQYRADGETEYDVAAIQDYLAGQGLPSGHTDAVRYALRQTRLAMTKADPKKGGG